MRTISRAARRIAVATSVLAAATTAAMATAAAPAAASGTVTFAAPGTYSYVVPPGVYAFRVEVYGAQGQGVGGLGGKVEAVVLSPGRETLTVTVGSTSGGGKGEDYGGDGGGLSSIRRGSTVLAVAGGGGGQGGLGGAGGAGGATKGEPGTPAPSDATTGGGPGTLATGGIGGRNGCLDPPCQPVDGDGERGSDNGMGGRGGRYFNGYGGGGGGSGYTGGGGGASGDSFYSTGRGGGGGGGSSFVTPLGALPLNMTPGVKAGSGSVVIETIASTAEQVHEPPTVFLDTPAPDQVWAVDGSTPFCIRAVDHAPDADDWVGAIDVTDSLGLPAARMTTPPTPSGIGACASPPTALPPGEYTWTARAIDIWGGISDPASPRRFTVVAGAQGRPLLSTGGLAFDGTAELSTFPCPPPPPFGTGPCAGEFNGEWSGSLAGVSTRSAYQVTWSAPPGSLHAAFDYAEWQCLGLETVLGLATGTGTATAVPGQVQGKWQVPGEGFARDIVGVTATFEFDWIRVGTTATLLLDPVSLTLDVAGLGAQPVITSPQTGVAAFVATHTDTVGVPTCATPLAVDGAIAGTVPLVQVTA